MKIPVFIMIAASVAYLFSPTIFAENEGPPRGDRPGADRPGADRPSGRPGERPGGRPGGGGSGFGGRRPLNPVLLVLDKDRNGTLSSEEIAGASAALKTLDKNGDGEITREEFRPTPGGPGGGSPGGGPGEFITRLMENDKNKDGKLSKEELPERMQRVLERADTSGDGALDKAELDAMAKRFTAGRGGQGGPGGERPGSGRPGGGPNGGDDRPKRPDFE